MLVDLPRKVLPLSGIPLTGVRGYAELPCREENERDLKSFLNAAFKEKVSINACVINAWWGEGKTYIYEDFLEDEVRKQGHTTFFVNASTIANAFRLVEKSDPECPVHWMHFLTALFDAILYEKANEPLLHLHPCLRDLKKLRSLRGVEEYINRLHKILEEEFFSKGIRIIVFIDEVERIETLSQSDRERFLLALRDLIDQKGLFKGMLHLILACTPDAYNRIISGYGRTTQIGALVERFQPVVKLNRPDLEESVKFVYGLIDYLYDLKEREWTTQLHPFVNSGPAYAIAYASYKGPRAMIKALQQVISVAEHEARKNGHRGKMMSINGELIVRALKGYNLPAFGMQIPALDKAMLDSLLGILDLGDQRTAKLQKLAILLIGEPIPHSDEELAKRIGVSINKLKEFVGILNNKAQEFGLLEGLVVAKVLKALPEVGVKVGRPLSTFVKRFVMAKSFNSRELILEYYVPRDKESLLSLTEKTDISAFEASRFVSSLSRYCEDSSPTYYLISQRFIERMYPTPEFTELDFIEKREKRLELWKKAYDLLSTSSRDCSYVFLQILRSSLSSSM